MDRQNWRWQKPPKRPDFFGAPKKSVRFCPIWSLIGAHITVGTDAAQVVEIFQGLKDLGAAHCMAFYVAGAFAQFKQYTIVAELNTRKKIGKKIRADLSAKAVVKFYDTSKIGAVHILAHKNGMAADFWWEKEAGNLVKGFTYPDFTGTAIPAEDFVVR